MRLVLVAPWAVPMCSCGCAAAPISLSDYAELSPQCAFLRKTLCTMEQCPHPNPGSGPDPNLNSSINPDPKINPSLHRTLWTMWYCSALLA